MIVSNAEGKLRVVAENLTCIEICARLDLNVAARGDLIGHPHIGVDARTRVGQRRCRENTVLAIFTVIVLQHDSVDSRHCACYCWYRVKIQRDDKYLGSLIWLCWMMELL